VIVLLSWLFLSAQMLLYAAELNVVLARRLWPRSLFQPPLTGPDRRVRGRPGRGRGAPSRGDRRGPLLHRRRRLTTRWRATAVGPVPRPARRNLPGTAGSPRAPSRVTGCGPAGCGATTGP